MPTNDVHKHSRGFLAPRPSWRFLHSLEEKNKTCHLPGRLLGNTRNSWRGTCCSTATTGLSAHTLRRTPTPTQRQQRWRHQAKRPKHEVRRFVQQCTPFHVDRAFTAFIAITAPTAVVVCAVPPSLNLLRLLPVRRQKELARRALETTGSQSITS